MIRRVALHRGIDPGDYFAQRFAALIQEDDAERMEDERKEKEQAEKKPKK